MNKVIRKFNNDLDLNEIISYVFTHDIIDQTNLNLENKHPYNVLYQNIFNRSLRYNKDNEFKRIVLTVTDVLKSSINNIIDKKTFVLYLNKYITYLDNICDICISYDIPELKYSLYEILITNIIDYNLSLICEFLTAEYSNQVPSLISIILNNCNNEVSYDKKINIINVIISNIYDKIIRSEETKTNKNLIEYKHYIDYLNLTNKIYIKLKSYDCFDDNFLSQYKKIRLQYIYHEFYKLINIDKLNYENDILDYVADSYVYISDEQINILITELDQYYANIIKVINFDQYDRRQYNEICKIIYKIYGLSNFIDKLNDLHTNIIAQILNEDNIAYYTEMLDNDIVNYYKLLCKQNDKDQIKKIYEDIFIKLFFIKYLSNSNTCFVFLGEYYKFLQNRLLNYNINTTNRLLVINVFEEKILSNLIDNLNNNSNERERKYWFPRLNNIIKDINHSIYYTNEFRKSKFSFLNNDKIIKFNKNCSNYMILSNHVWTNIHPFMKSNYLINYPDKLKIYIASLEQHYKLSCPYKKLHIINHLSTYTLNWLYNNKKIQLKCNLIQTAVLLLFEKQNNFMFEEDIHRLLFGSDILITSDSINYISQVLKSLVDAGIIIYNTNCYSLNNNIDKSEINVIKFFENLDNRINKINTHNDNILAADKEILVDCFIVKYVKNIKECNIDNLFHYVKSSYKIDKDFFLKRCDKLIENYYIEIIDDNVIYID